MQIKNGNARSRQAIGETPETRKPAEFKLRRLIPLRLDAHRSLDAVFALAPMIPL